MQACSLVLLELFVLRAIYPFEVYSVPNTLAIFVNLVLCACGCRLWLFAPLPASASREFSSLDADVVVVEGFHAWIIQVIVVEVELFQNLSVIIIYTLFFATS